MPQDARSAASTDSAAPQLRPHHVRTLALAGAVVGVVLLPIAAAQATPPQNHDRQASAGSTPGSGLLPGLGQPSTIATPTPAAATPAQGDPAASPTDPGSQALTPEFCGAVRTATVTGGTVRVQSCVEQSDGAASGRVYVANGTAGPQTVALNLTRTDGSVVQVQCTIAAGDASGVCATDPVALSGGTGGYNAIAELASAGAPLSAGVVHVESGLVAPAAQ